MDATKVIPVKRAKAPRYPNLIEVRNDPSLLKHIPQRWQAYRKAIAAVGVLATITLTGCATGGAPLPPPFMTEADAMRIITDTAKEYGLELTLEVKRSDLPKDIDYFLQNSTTPIDMDYLHYMAEGDQLDAYDADKKVGFEYMTTPSGDSSTDLTNLQPDKSTDKNRKGDAAVLLFGPVYENETDQLKQQVTDFLDWLKSVGTI